MRVTMHVEVHVEDEQRLAEYAARRVSVCWNDSVENIAGPDTPNVAQAVFEALIGSNEGPSPDQIGIEIGNYTLEVD